MFFYLLIGKIVFFISQKFKIGNGSTWPGHIVLFFQKKFIEKTIKNNPQLKIILVGGTNGKTTTVSAISFILKKLGYRVFHNQEGANLINGIASSIIKNININGKLNYEFAVFEIDEFTFPLILKEISNPTAIIILNLFRDQLDRYGEVNTIGKRWFDAFKFISQKTLFIINGDDPFLYYKGIHIKSKKIFFGISENLMSKKDLSSDIDFNYCPRCGNLLFYKKISYAHLGDYLCKKCGFKKNKNVETFEREKINYPLLGLYNIYNFNAVLSLVKSLDLKINFLSIFKDFHPVFGRQERLFFRNRFFYIFLSKNPAGFNQSLQTAKEILTNKKAILFFILNNRVPDGRDISWIWDVDFNIIIKNVKKIFVSGDRVYDLALRFKYENIKTKIFENFREAIREIIKSTKNREKIYVFPTYSAMIEIRNFLTGKKFF